MIETGFQGVGCPQVSTVGGEANADETLLGLTKPSIKEGSLAK